MKYIWIIAGFLFLGVGLLGVVLPILPTTPFVIVSVFCFAKGSKRLHTWLLSTNLYQNHVKKFNETRSMTLKSKIVILAFASSMLIAGFYFSNNIYARTIIIVLIVAALPSGDIEIQSGKFKLGKMPFYSSFQFIIPQEEIKQTAGGVYELDGLIGVYRVAASKPQALLTGILSKDVCELSLSVNGMGKKLTMQLSSIQSQALDDDTEFH